MKKFKKGCVFKELIFIKLDYHMEDLIKRGKSNPI